jgi:hypothetical protein
MRRSKNQGQVIFSFLAFFLLISGIFLFRVIQTERNIRTHMLQEITRIAGSQISRERADCLNQISTNNRLILRSIFLFWENHILFKKMFFEWILQGSNEFKHRLVLDRSGQFIKQEESQNKFFKKFKQQHEMYWSFLINRMISLSKRNQSIIKKCLSPSTIEKKTSKEANFSTFNLQNALQIAYSLKKEWEKKRLPYQSFEKKISLISFHQHKINKIGKWETSICTPFNSPLSQQSFRQKLKDYGLLTLSKMHPNITTPQNYCGTISFEKIIEPFSKQIKIYMMNQRNLKKLMEKTFFLRLETAHLEKFLKKNSKLAPLLSNYNAIKKRKTNLKIWKSIQFQGIEKLVLPHVGLKKQRLDQKFKDFEHRFTVKHKGLTTSKSKEIWFSPNWQDIYLGSRLFFYHLPFEKLLLLR